MMTYLIKMTLCVMFLYVVYVVLLEKENRHRFKRVYLLASLFFSLLVPFVLIDMNIPQIPAYLEKFYNILPNEMKVSGMNRYDFAETTTQADGNAIAQADGNMSEQSIANSAVQSYENMKAVYGKNLTQSGKNRLSILIENYLPVLAIYLMITSLFMFRFIRNCRQMLKKAHNNDSLSYRDAMIVLVNEKVVPHSFGRYIFINKNDYDRGVVPEEVVVHEWTHVRQRHTYDILFIELLITFGWFNPVFFLYKNKIKQNHEFLADDAVIGTNKAMIPSYISILISQISLNTKISFTSNFNFLITQKRIIMMTKTISKKRAW